MIFIACRWFLSDDEESSMKCDDIVPDYYMWDKILDTQITWNRRENMRFFRMCGYFWSMTIKYAGKVKPLKPLEYLLHKEMLGHLKFGEVIEISVDASGEAAGAMVAQNGKIVRVF
jgi:hypothetical protein